MNVIASMTATTTAIAVGASVIVIMTVGTPDLMIAIQSGIAANGTVTVNGPAVVNGTEIATAAGVAAAPIGIGTAAEIGRVRTTRIEE
jgi:hypothetical protein